MKIHKNQPKLTPSKIKRILVPFDFSVNSSNALRKAILMAKSFMAEIDLIHVITPVYATPNDSSLLIKSDVFYQKLIKEATAHLEKIAKDAGSNHNIKINCKASLNVVYKEILNYSIKRKSDLIIMGTHGVSGITEFFAGSNAYRVVSEARCPVITVQKRTDKNIFKKIVLPIRTELNTRQKTNLVANLAKTFKAKVYIVGYLDSTNKIDKIKVTSYVKQVENFLNAESIEFESTLIKDTNFTKSILDYATAQKADLVAVMTTHDFSMGQLFTGSYSQQFVNHSKIPVLSIPNTLNFEYGKTNFLIGEMPF